MSQSAVLSEGGGTVAEWERGAQMKVKTNKSFNPLSHGGMRGSAGCDSTFPSPGDIWRTGLGAPTAIMIFYASPFFFLFFFSVYMCMFRLVLGNVLLLLITNHASKKTCVCAWGQKSVYSHICGCLPYLGKTPSPHDANH